MLISSTTGNENWEHASAKCQLFFTPTTDFPGKEVPMWRMSKGDNPSVPVEQMANTRTAAAPGLIDAFGFWNTAAYDIPEGVLLKLFAQRKNTSIGAGGHLLGSMFLRAREDAPLIRVSVGLIGDSRAAFTAVHTEGRFDVILLAGAENMGAVVSSFRNQHDPDVRAAMFTVSELAGGSSAPVHESVEIENSDGQRVIVREIRPRRAIDLG